MDLELTLIAIALTSFLSLVISWAVLPHGDLGQAATRVTLLDVAEPTVDLKAA